LTDTLWVSEPEVAVIVICDVAGVGELGAGVEGDDGVALLIPLPQPVTAPMAVMQSRSRSAVRMEVSLRRIPPKPRRLRGSKLASMVWPRCRRVAV